jgi:RNA polymerase subunit RPABC4/transcription elongation factor Spt4
MAGVFGFIVWVLFCILIGKCADRWNRSFVKYLLLSLIFSPLILGIILLIMGKNNETRSSGNVYIKGTSPNQRNLSTNEKKCKSCGSIITDDYKRCPNCGSGEFYDDNESMDLSSAGKIAINSGEDKIICPYCKTKIILNIPVKEFKNMHCTKCNKKITSKNVLFED